MKGRGKIMVNEVMDFITGYDKEVSMVITGLSQLKIFLISNKSMILIKQYHMTLKRGAYNGDMIKTQEWEH